MPSFIERGMLFIFPDDWYPICYEETTTHKKHMMPLQNTKAVDFLCCYQNRLLLIEAKRYKEKSFMDIENLVNEISWQFKDTLCGIALCHVRGEDSMKRYSDALLPQQPSEHHTLIVFLEIQTETRLPKCTIQANVLQLLNKRFVPLGFAVRVLDSTKMSKSPWKVEMQG